MVKFTYRQLVNLINLKEEHFFEGFYESDKQCVRDLRYYLFNITSNDTSLNEQEIDWDLVRIEFYKDLEDNKFKTTLSGALEFLKERGEEDIGEAIEAVDNDLISIANYYIEQQQLDYFWTMLDMQFGIQLDMGEDWEQWTTLQ